MKDVHTEEEIEILEDVSQQLKKILAKFNNIHKTLAQNKKTETKKDFPAQIMNKLGFNCIFYQPIKTQALVIWQWQTRLEFLETR